MNISIRIEDAAIQNKLKELASHLHNLQPLMSRIGKWYESRIDENFTNESAPDGTKWKPLSAITLMLGIAGKKGNGFKKSGYLGAKGKNYIKRKSMLFQRGDLKNSIHHQADSSRVIIGSMGIPYAAIHQFGGKAGRGRKVTIPARPYLAMTKGKTLVLAERDRDNVVKMIQEEIDKIVK